MSTDYRNHSDFLKKVCFEIDVILGFTTFIWYARYLNPSDYRKSLLTNLLKKRGIKV